MFECLLKNLKENEMWDWTGYEKQLRADSAGFDTNVDRKSDDRGGGLFTG